MVDKRLIGKQANGGCGAASVNADSPLPDRLAELERQIGVALSSSEHTAAELTGLLGQLERAIPVATEFARLESENSLDPLACPDPRQARQQAEDANFLSARLATLKGRLSIACSKQINKEKVADYLVKRDAIAPERDQLQQDFTDQYPLLCGKLLELFARLKDFQKRVGIELADPPAGVHGLDAFTPATLSLLDATKLFDAETGRTQLWPPATVPLDVTMAAGMQFSRDVRYTPDWWKANAQRVADAQRENEATAARFAQMQAEQTERINREEKERWHAAHGGVK